MSSRRLQNLFGKYLSNVITSEELVEFYDLMNNIDEDEFSSLVDSYVDLEGISFLGKDSLYNNKIKKQLSPIENIIDRPKKRLINFSLLKNIAATVILISSISLLIYKFYINTNISNESYEIIPIEDFASIKLADGKKISLDSTLQDTIHYKGLTVHRLNDGTISLSSDVDIVNQFDLNESHQFLAKKGSVLKLELQDGSKVELNSGSRLDLSVGYGIRNRSVNLNGEGYFEIEHNPKIPFKVNVMDAQIQVLGTKFNISAYDQDQSMTTSLIDGSIAISSVFSKHILKPGQQAIFNKNSIDIVERADLSKVLSWRQGYFKFKNESVENILHELSKWYPINEIRLEAKNSDRFTGSIKRTKDLSEVLQNIEQISNLKFKLYEGRVTVMK